MSEGIKHSHVQYLARRVEEEVLWAGGWPWMGEKQRVVRKEGGERDPHEDRVEKDGRHRV